jgi:hypothetical protein
LVQRSDSVALVAKRAEQVAGLGAKPAKQQSKAGTKQAALKA